MGVGKGKGGARARNGLRVFGLCQRRAGQKEDRTVRYEQEVEAKSVKEKLQALAGIGLILFVLMEVAGFIWMGTR